MAYQLKEVLLDLIIADSVFDSGEFFSVLRADDFPHHEVHHGGLVSFVEVCLCKVNESLFIRCEIWTSSLYKLKQCLVGDFDFDVVGEVIFEHFKDGVSVEGIVHQ